MTALDMDTEIDVLSDADWQPTFPCEGHRHDELHVPRGDARFLQRGVCPRCLKAAPDLAVCVGGRHYREAICDRTRCETGCRQESPTGEWGFTFAPIGGAQ